MNNMPKLIFSFTILSYVIGSISVKVATCFILPNEEDNNCKNIEILTKQVLSTYYLSHKCTVLITMMEMFHEFNTDLGTSFIQIAPQEKCDYGLANKIAEGFKQNCDSYIVQVDDPLCFLKIWHISLQMTFHRHNPIFFFLPDCKNRRNHAMEILSAPESDITVNIIVVELEFNDNNKFKLNHSEDWPVTLWTNDFSKLAGSPERTKIFVDSWHPIKGFRFNNNLFYDKILNLKGRVLRVAAFTYPPYTIVEKNTIDGIEMRIAFLFCRLYNCTIETVYDDGLWGTILGNGSGDGILGMVYKNKADIGFGGIYLWLEPAYYLDYSDTWLYAAATLLVPKPVPLGGWRVPFLPFDLAMWTAVFLSLAISSFCISFASWLINRKRYNVDVYKLLGINDTILMILGMSVLQPPSRQLSDNHVSINQMVTSVAIMCLLLTSCYSAGLSSYLTVPQFTNPIDTFDELSASGLYWLAIHEAWVYSLQQVEDEKVQAVVKHFRKLSEERLLSEAPKGKYGLAVERLPAGHFAEQSHLTDDVISNSHIMKENLFGSLLTTALRKGGTYRPVTNFVPWTGAEAHKLFLTNKWELPLIHPSL
ncbi:ionotropic receptor 21a-like isoform X3 [Rhodnius prolixus]|uniref:ionotropic receptor 21a-like isoform X3 n=1 Tax=Rhodnius prolixus TaxID=13249 RepID=UPI003D18AD09